jgi:hypothetical protein
LLVVYITNSQQHLDVFAHTYAVKAGSMPLKVTHIFISNTTIKKTL